MALTLVTYAKLFPITLDEAKNHLRVTSTDEDEVILNSIKSATVWAEGITGFKYCTQTWNYFIDKFPSGVIRMPYPPLASVTHIKYYDSDNSQQTYDSANYRVDIDSDPGRIEPINSWPSTFSKVNAVEIQFVCGHTHQDLIDEDVKHAIKLKITDLYENRQTEYVAMGALRIANTNTATEILNGKAFYERWW